MKVAEYRRYLGLSQTDLANLLGVSLQAYWKKEKGITPFKDDEKIKITKLFQKTLPNIDIMDIFFSELVPKVVSK